MVKPEFTEADLTEILDECTPRARLLIVHLLERVSKLEQRVVDLVPRLQLAECGRISLSRQQNDSVWPARQRLRRLPDEPTLKGRRRLPRKWMLSYQGGYRRILREGFLFHGDMPIMAKPGRKKRGRPKQPPGKNLLEIGRA